MILTCAQMKEQEERAFQDGCTPEGLMEEAGLRIALAVRQFLPEPGRCAVFFGKGHNGGDALVAARHLAEAGWKIDLQPAFLRSAWAELTARKFGDLRERGIDLSAEETDFRRLTDWRPTAVLDGLLGIGATGSLRDPISEAALAMNRIRAFSNARVFAIDLPTGLDADTGAADPNTVTADVTLTIGFAKAGLLADSATAFVGRLAVLPLPGLRFRGDPEPPAAEVADPQTLGPLLPRRPFTMHKGQCGRIGVVAGSAGFLGAAILASEACVHAGAGLVTLYVSPDIYPLVASRIATEVMVHSTASYEEILEIRHDVLALGPGLGRSRGSKVLALIEKARQPMVVDADGLNLLAPHIELLGRCAGPRLLTPHPGEMARLLGKGDSPGSADETPRRQIVEKFIAQWPVALLLKGSRTIIGERGRPLSYNTTGSPGMATGGMGDVLTGVCAALAGQGLALYDAARLGAWLCGRAAEIAIESGRESEESLSAGRLSPLFGRVFKELREGCW
jgi:ADP-dependent NAD(P)H-hydrate dehydratase / NAD(P)H-hydrate epimerase